MVQFRVNPPKFPLTWIINALSMSRERGLGLMQRPLKVNTYYTKVTLKVNICHTEVNLKVNTCHT